MCCKTKVYTSVLTLIIQQNILNFPNLVKTDDTTFSVSLPVRSDDFLLFYTPSILFKLYVYFFKCFDDSRYK